MAPNGGDGGIALYAAPPAFAIALEELESAALSRLKMLLAVNVLSERSPLVRERQLAEECPFYLQTTSDAKLDLTSHYALRLAFCT